MRALGVIPARIGATRFPGKPLALLRGRPLVQHVWDRATACPDLARVVVATDDEKIAASVRGFGGEAILTRADHASGTDRVAEVACRPEFRDFGAIVNLQGDEPLLDPAAMGEALVPVAAGEAGLSTLAHRETDPGLFASPDVVKVVTRVDGNALYFSRAPIGPPGGFLRHIGLYVFERATLERFTSLSPTPLERAERLEQLRALEHGIRIRVVITSRGSRGVDTPADLAALERDWDALAGISTPDPKESPR